MECEDPNDMTASELLLKAGNGYEGANGTVMVNLIDLMGLSRNIRHSECFYVLAAKIEAELAQARGKALRQGAMVWAKANGWPDFRDGEDFGAWLDRCALMRPRYDNGDPVDMEDFGDPESDDFAWYTVSDSGDWTIYAPAISPDPIEGDISERVKRPAPEALGADGLPIVVGETAYDTKTGIEITVSRITKDEGDNVIVCASGDICELQFDPRHITHTPPDTQEKIDEGVGKGYISYWGCRGVSCESCPAKIDGDKPWQRYGAGSCEDARVLDLLRRQRELDKRTGVDHD